MIAIDQIMAEKGLVLPDVVTGYIGAKSLPIDSHASQLALHFPGTGERLTLLQEDDAATVAQAIACARDSFQTGAWSRTSTTARQGVFRRGAKLIR